MSFMPVKGYAGKYLRVNLSEGSLVDEVYDEATLRRHLGGTGMGAKVLYEETPKDAEFSDPRNVVMIASGPLGGTTVGGSGTISVVTKGALTGGATSVQANGLFGAYMKFSGYDGVILTGASSDGARGLLEIKSHGGLVAVQDPDTAESSLMPMSAIDLCKPHRIIKLDEIGQWIAETIQKGECR